MESKFSKQKITSYKAFWPVYVSLHHHPMTRNLHFTGTVLVLCAFALTVLVSPLFLLAAPVAGYSFAWFSHFYFEKNAPATFTYPFWSLIADFQMFVFMCLGKMDREVKRMGVLRQG